MNKLSLISDFTDFYDKCFSTNGDYIFERTTYNGRDRIQDLNFLGTHFNTPLHGTVREVFNKFHDSLPFYKNNVSYPGQFYKVVVYLDKTAHNGTYKVLLNLNDALKNYSEYYCSVYIPPYNPNYNISYRWLVIGDSEFYLEYRSERDLYNQNDSEWRSNFYPSITLLQPTLKYNKDIYGNRTRECNDFKKYPLFAVDFVTSADRFYAIDFNTAPGINETGLEIIYKPEKIYRMIENYILSNPTIYNKE